MSAPSTPAWMRTRKSLKVYIGGAVVVAVLVLISSFRYKSTPLEARPSLSLPDALTDGDGKWQFHHSRDSRNLGLSDKQCDTAFPKLYTEIERARVHFDRASIHREQVKIHWDSKPWPHAQMHVLVYNGQMYVIDEKEGACNRARGLAGLSNLYRAITAVDDPTTIPNVEFILDLEDTPTETVPEDRIVWSWNRPKTNQNTWVVPDFDGWAFPEADLGSYISFREKLKFVEMPFEDKDPRAVWRGAMNNKVRTALMNAAQGYEWADVQTMTSETRMHMVDFCKYKFPVHTEGNTWSGRLRYLQNCNSIIVVHQPLEFQAHYYDLLVAEGPDQNFISVRNDFSDLHEKMQYYLSNAATTARIANNSVATFRDRYLTPAAEACYWRRLIRAWAEVQAFSPEAYVDIAAPDGSVWKKQRGVDWEIFAHPDPNFPFRFPEGRHT